MEAHELGDKAALLTPSGLHTGVATFFHRRVLRDNVPQQMLPARQQAHQHEKYQFKPIAQYVKINHCSACSITTREKPGNDTLKKLMSYGQVLLSSCVESNDHSVGLTEHRRKCRRSGSSLLGASPLVFRLCVVFPSVPPSRQKPTCQIQHAGQAG